MMSACFAKPPTEAVRFVAAADRAMMLVVPIVGHVRKRHRMCHTESACVRLKASSDNSSVCGSLVN